MVYSSDSKEKIKQLLLLSPLAILPDLDVFLGIHRGLFHSLFFILPLITLIFFVARDYWKFAAFFLVSHLLLDFITGGVPFLYPLIDTGVGVKFPFIVKFESFPSVVEYLPKIVFTTPSTVYGKTFDVFSSFGIASLVVFAGIYYLRSRKSD